jgi:hypothetical protein
MGSTTPVGGLSPRPNTGGCDWRLTPEKLRMPPENSAPVNNTISLENRPALKSPPSKTTPVPSEFRPCQVTAASLRAFGAHDPACLVAILVFLVLAGCRRSPGWLLGQAKRSLRPE